jgi:hypothetical protein
MNPDLGSNDAETTDGKPRCGSIQRLGRPVFFVEPRTATAAAPCYAFASCSPGSTAFHRERPVPPPERHIGTLDQRAGS